MINCIVAIKQVLDPYVAIRVKTDESGVETTNVKVAMNPFDQIAVEEAVRLKESGIINNIKVLSIGPSSVQESLRQALAMGADEGLLINTIDMVSPLIVAKIIKQIIATNPCDLVLLGKQAIDDDCNQTGQMLAAILGWAQGTFISKLQIDLNSNLATVTREVDGGLENLILKLPCVITTDLRLNEPRYISLPNVMQAKRKKIEIIELNSIDVPNSSAVKTIKVVTPQKRKSGIILKDAAELMDKLKNEAHVL